MEHLNNESLELAAMGKELEASQEEHLLVCDRCLTRVEKEAQTIAFIREALTSRLNPASQQPFSPVPLVRTAR